MSRWPPCKRNRNKNKKYKSSSYQKEKDKMITVVVVVLASLIPMLPIGAYFMNKRSNNPLKSTQDLVLAFKAYNLMLGLMAAGFVAMLVLTPDAVLASGLAQEEAGNADVYASLAAGLATGLGSIGAGIAVSGTGAAAVGAIAEKPEAFCRSLIFVGLAEGVALYGLIISILVLFS
jgi:V/A-type H+-transporting ATPase subunit K